MSRYVQNHQAGFGSRCKKRKTHQKHFLLHPLLSPRQSSAQRAVCQCSCVAVEQCVAVWQWYDQIEGDGYDGSIQCPASVGALCSVSLYHLHLASLYHFQCSGGPPALLTPTYTTAAHTYVRTLLNIVTLCINAMWNCVWFRITGAPNQYQYLNQYQYQSNTSRPTSNWCHQCSPRVESLAYLHL